MPSQLIHCVYASSATREYDTAELTKLLEIARRNNESLGLTGMLLYAEGSFFQVLEGPAAVVDEIYEKIEADPRHDKVTKIIREPIPRRSFDAWTMGFFRVSREELEGVAGVNDFFGKGLSFEKLDAGRAKKLLAAFREGRWRRSGNRPHLSASP